MFSWLSEYTFYNSLGMNMILFHDFLLVILLGVVIFVGLLMGFVLKSSFIVSGYIEHKNLEFLWTLIPVFLVHLIFLPSVFMLKSSFYSNSFFENMVNVIGHQWNWEYEYFLDGESYSFTASPTKKNNFRLLDTSGYVFINSKKNTLFNISSEDVIHSFSLPELGVKVDAVPGRVKEIMISGLVDSVGMFSGQCSEICGVFHSKMPMVVVSLPL